MRGRIRLGMMYHKSVSLGQLQNNLSGHKIFGHFPKQ